jgi:CRP-like cAMP-binding protein
LVQQSSGGYESPFVDDDDDDDEAGAPDVTLLASLRMRGMTPELNLLSCAQQLDWEARAHLRSSASVTKNRPGSPCASPRRPGEPNYEHTLPDRIVKARVSHVESKLATKLRRLMSTDEKQAQAWIARELRAGDTAAQRRQQRWLQVVAVVVPVAHFVASLRYNRADRVIRTLFAQHVISYFKRRRARQARQRWTADKLHEMPPVALDLLATAMPRAAAALHAMPRVITNSVLFGGDPPAPTVYAAAERRALANPHLSPEIVFKHARDLESKCPFRPVVFCRGDYAFYSPSSIPFHRPAGGGESGSGAATATTAELRGAAKRHAANFSGHASGSTLKQRLDATCALFIQSGQLHVSYRVPGRGCAVHRYRETHGPGSIVRLDAVLGKHGRPHVAVCESDVTGFSVPGVILNKLLASLDDAVERYTKFRQHVQRAPSDGGEADQGLQAAMRAVVGQASNPDDADAARGPHAPKFQREADDDDDDSDSGARRLTLHPSFLGVVLARRLGAVGAVPLAPSVLRASTTYFSLWSDRGLRALSQCMAPMTIQRGSVLPCDDSELLELLDAQMKNLALHYRGVDFSAFGPTWRHHKPSKRVVVHGATRNRQPHLLAGGTKHEAGGSELSSPLRHTASGSSLRPTGSATSGPRQTSSATATSAQPAGGKRVAGHVATVFAQQQQPSPARAPAPEALLPRNRVAYVVVHGTLTRLASADQGGQRVTSGTAGGSVAGGTIQSSNGGSTLHAAGDNGDGVHVRTGMACGVREAILESRTTPRYAATTDVDLWAMRESDILEFLAHEDAAALIPAFAP